MSQFLSMFSSAGPESFSKMACQVAPYFSTINPLVTDLRKGSATVQVPFAREITNHLGTVHAIAMCNAAELAEIGAAEVRITDYGAVLATIPATAPGPVIGLLAHVDTAPAFAAQGVKPVVHRGYNGGAITFADAPDLLLSPEISPYLAEKLGEDIITASGTTLLGADDKAGVAILMTAARHLLAHPEIPHPTLRIAFTPDEEIGRGVDARLPKDLGADFAFTFDGAKPGEIEFESFSADGAVVKITGISAHPGYAKGKLVNALHLAADFLNAVRALQARVAESGHRDGDYDVPYSTIHVGKMAGGVQVNIVPNTATLDFEIRSLAEDDPETLIADLRAATEAIVAPLRATFPEAEIRVERLWDYPGLGTPSDAAVVNFVKGLTGANGTIKVAFGTEGGLFAQHLGIPTVICGPGSMAQGHKPDEFVTVEQMARGAAMLDALLARCEAGF